MGKQKTEKIELTMAEMDTTFRSLKDTLTNLQAIGKKALACGFKDTARATMKEAVQIEEIMNKFLTEPGGGEEEE